jgi:hypothetical protein
MWVSVVVCVIASISSLSRDSNYMQRRLVTLDRGKIVM